MADRTVRHPGRTYLVGCQHAEAGPGGQWHARAASLFVTEDAEVFLAEARPAAAAAGLRVRVLTRDRRQVVTERERFRFLPWLPLYRHCESWSVWHPVDALSYLRHMHRWDRDDVQAERQWTALAGGDQVLIWDPVWGRDDRLWPVLEKLHLPWAGEW